MSQIIISTTGLVALQDIGVSLDRLKLMAAVEKPAVY